MTASGVSALAAAALSAPDAAAAAPRGSLFGMGIVVLALATAGSALAFTLVGAPTGAGLPAPLVVVLALLVALVAARRLGGPGRAGLGAHDTQTGDVQGPDRPHGGSVLPADPPARARAAPPREGGRAQRAAQAAAEGTAPSPVDDGADDTRETRAPAEALAQALVARLPGAWVCLRRGGGWALDAAAADDPAGWTVHDPAENLTGSAATHPAVALPEWLAQQPQGRAAAVRAALAGDAGAALEAGPACTALRLADHLLLLWQAAPEPPQAAAASPEGGPAAAPEAGSASVPAEAPASAGRHAAAAGGEDSEQADPLAAAERERQSFVYAVSHDLRAPLRVIEGFARIVKEDYGSGLDRIGNDHVDRILGAAGRMGHMIDALLALSRLGTQPLQQVEVDLSALAAQVVDELQRQTPQRRVEVRIEPGLMARGDPTLLRIVLDNLLGNAWKYTARRNPAHLVFGPAAAGITRPAGVPAGARVFCIADDGAGFDMRFADRLFMPFQRLHSASEFAGTGVGLASVRRIVHRHGGEIWAEAEIDRGARFCFSLG